MRNLLKPDKITNGLLTSLLEDTWRLEKAGNVKNLTQTELISIHKALLNYDRNLRYEFGDDSPFFDFIASTIDQKSEAEAEKLDLQLYKNKGIEMYNGLKRKASWSDDIYNGEGKKIIWYENGDLSLYTSHVQFNGEGLSYFHIDVDNMNLFNYTPINLIRFIDDGGRKIHFSEGLGDIYLYFYLLTNISQNYHRMYPLEYVISLPEHFELSCFSMNIRNELWESIITLIKDIVTNGKDVQKLNFLEFAFEFMFLLSIEPSLSDLYQIMTAINQHSSRTDESGSAIISMLKRIDSRFDGFDTNIQEIKNDVKTIDAKLDILVNDFNIKTTEIQTLINTNSDELSGLITTKSDELVIIINQLYKNNLDEDYQNKQQELTKLYPELNLKDEALQALSSGFILAEQSNLERLDQSGAILLLSKGLEILLNKIFKTFMIKSLSNNVSFVSSMTKKSHKPKDKGMVEWLLDKNCATLGQVAFFCAHFNTYYIGKEVNKVLGINTARKGSDEAIAKGLMEFINAELTNKDVHHLRNGFVHSDIAEIGDLNWVVTKTTNILNGLNLAVSSNR